MDIRDAIRRVSSFTDLTEKETYDVFTVIMKGAVTPAQIGAFLVGLKMKGESVPEITGAVKAVREKCIKIKAAKKGEVILDTCGTGGTGKCTFNISTASALIAAACGVKVAKHGNRAASGKCGSADVLQALGVKIDVSPARAGKCIRDIGIGFLFAPSYHKAMKYASGPRKEISVRTIFNLIGPLANPAFADRQVMGIYDAALTEKVARVMNGLGIKHAFVVHGLDDGHDEASISGRTKVTELKGKTIRSYILRPSDFGLKEVSKKFIKCRSVRENAVTLKAVLNGKKGPALDVVLMNASLALLAAGRVRNIKEGVRVARSAVESGKAIKKLKELIKLTNMEKRR